MYASMYCDNGERPRMGTRLKASQEITARPRIVLLAMEKNDKRRFRCLVNYGGEFV